MKEWYQRNAKCFASSYKREEDTKRLRSGKIRPMKNDDTENLGSTEDENEDGQSSNTCHDQDSDISFTNDSDEEIDTTALKKNGLNTWKEAQMKPLKRWRMQISDVGLKLTKEWNGGWLALRIASLPGERWIVKAAEWNPELSSRYKTYRAIGRPRRWEDDINEFLKLDETVTEIST